MLAGKEDYLGNKFWAMAAEHATYLFNNTPIKSLNQANQDFEKVMDVYGYAKSLVQTNRNIQQISWLPLASSRMRL